MEQLFSWRTCSHLKDLPASRKKTNSLLSLSHFHLFPLFFSPAASITRVGNYPRTLASYFLCKYFVSKACVAIVFCNCAAAGCCWMLLLRGTNPPPRCRLTDGVRAEWRLGAPRWSASPSLSVQETRVRAALPLTRRKSGSRIGNLVSTAVKKGWRSHVSHSSYL